MKTFGSLKFLILLLPLFLLACGTGEDDGVVGTGLDKYKFEIPGTAQKGPFLLGSRVEIDKLLPNGFAADGYATETYDDLGNFDMYATDLGPHLISVTGLHFNEILNNISISDLTLTAVYNVKKENNYHAYVSILTHLSANRATYLMKYSNYGAEQAIRQAESDVLNALKDVLPLTELSEFTRLSLYNVDESNSAGNAYVLALSATIYQFAILSKEEYPDYTIDALLRQRLNLIANDIAKDGLINDDPNTLSNLKRAMHMLRPDQITKNLESYANFAGHSGLPVANMNLFIDTDGDGTVNEYDDDDDGDGILDWNDANQYDPSDRGIVSYLSDNTNNYQIVIDENGYDTIIGDDTDMVLGFATFSANGLVRTIDGGGGTNIIVGNKFRNVLDFSNTTLINIARIEGKDDGDFIIGSAGNDVIVGGPGNDSLKGNAGDDTFWITGSDEGSNVVNGGEGFDQVLGFTTDDVFQFPYFTGENTVEKIDGGGGTDIIATSKYGGLYDFRNTELVNISKILGAVLNDKIIGSKGDDVIEGGEGADALSGDEGNDTFLVRGLYDGFDLINGGPGIDQILGSDDDDIIGFSSFSGDNTVEIIDGKLGTNIIRGYQYYSTLDFSNTVLINIARIEGQKGNDRITGSSKDDVIVGGPGNDVLIGSSGDDLFLIEGQFDGVDTISGGDGIDSIVGSDMDDYISLNNHSGENVVEIIDGKLGTNIVRGSPSRNTLDFRNTELVNILRIEGMGGNDIIYGSPANDVIVGGEDNDTLFGEGGDDIFLVEDQFSGVDTINGGDGFDQLAGTDGDDIFGLYTFKLANTVERIDGKLGKNIIRGNATRNTLDFRNTELVNIARIEGMGESDIIYGSSADDIIVGGEGHDTLFGEGGDDLFLVEGEINSYDVVNGGDGIDKIVGSDGDDVIGLYRFELIDTVEQIDGGSGLNIISGSNAKNILDFSNTELLNIFSIKGWGGDDQITGNAADNVI
ncbi:MAG: hypothetical protein OEZ47_14375, partial [Gammaproteobacteria bacterium]|nr:hypothetical protein [Gammaproteobacteria bacterium]